jgi:hypothetical protein
MSCKIYNAAPWKAIDPACHQKPCTVKPHSWIYLIRGWGQFVNRVKKLRCDCYYYHLHTTTITTIQFVLHHHPYHHILEGFFS